MDALVSAAATLSVVFGGLMAGLYFAFSLSVIPGLTAAGSRHAVPAMRAMNDRILRPVFFLAFFGAPLAPLITGALLLADGDNDAATAFLLAGGVCALGALVPTIAVNVPLNERLAGAAGPPHPGARTPDETADRHWAAYAPRWHAWNTLRVVASTLSLLIAALGMRLL